MNYNIYICKTFKIWGCVVLIRRFKGNYADIGWLHIRLINKVTKFVNGNVSEVGTREDLVATLQNNLLTVNEPVLA